MKIKLSLLINSINSLNELIKKDLPIKVAYALSKNIKKINDEMRAFEDIKNKLFEKYGEDIEEKGKKFKRIKEENLKIYQEELNKIIDDVCEIDIHKVKIDQFEDVKIKPGDLIAISFMLED
ncbi:MAG: hypothetical protein ACTSWG_13090 [Candidatus Helarchaeota archaeon]